MNRARRFSTKKYDELMREYVKRQYVQSAGRPAKKPVQMQTYVRGYANRSVTENGAVGYRTTTHPLLDLNFMVSSLRNRKEKEIGEMFAKAYYDSPKYAVKWAFFLRDICEGLGERRSFRVILQYLSVVHPEVCSAVLALVPQYGRYDDWLCLLYTPVGTQVCKLMKEQLLADQKAMKEARPVSLLAKWLPSINTSSYDTRADARYLAQQFGMSEREYRKALSALRAYSNVVEVKMSANEWSAIDYEKVPAKATMKYDDAFLRHDFERRVDYFRGVISGDAKLNGKGIMPYEVVQRIKGETGVFGRFALKDDLLAELMWEHMTVQGFQNEWGLEDCIVVADGSGSMYTNVSGSSSVQAIDVCHSLAVYFAQQLKGVFHNKAITFSAQPQFIDLDKGKTLKEKLEIMHWHNEVENTNIEAVFDMLLDMALSHEVPAQELPKQLLIISDMEFDRASVPRWRDESWKPMSEALFETIRQRYEKAGYKVPRLIFWNVCGRSDTIPQVDNEEGICLLSGFSQNAMKIAADKEVRDPYESLLRLLDSPRYEPVEKALAELLI